MPNDHLHDRKENNDTLNAFRLIAALLCGLALGCIFAIGGFFVAAYFIDFFIVRKPSTPGSFSGNYILLKSLGYAAVSFFIGLIWGCSLGYRYLLPKRSEDARATNEGEPRYQQ